MPRGSLSEARHPEEGGSQQQVEEGRDSSRVGPEPSSQNQDRDSAMASAIPSAVPGVYQDSGNREVPMQGALSLSPSPSPPLSLSPSPSTCSLSMARHRRSGRPPLVKHSSEVLDRTQSSTPLGPEEVPAGPHRGQGMSPDWIQMRPKTRGEGGGPFAGGAAPWCTRGVPPVPPAPRLDRAQTMHPDVLRKGAREESRHPQEGSRKERGRGGAAKGRGHRTHGSGNGRQGRDLFEEEEGAPYHEGLRPSAGSPLDAVGASGAAAAAGPEETQPPLLRTQCMVRGSRQPLATLPLRMDSDGDDGEDGGVLLADPLGSPVDVPSGTPHLDTCPGPAPSAVAAHRTKLSFLSSPQPYSGAEPGSGPGHGPEEGAFCLGQQSPRPLRQSSYVPQGFASPGYAAGRPSLGSLRHCSSDAASHAGYTAGSPGVPSPPHPGIPSPHPGTVAGTSLHASMMGQTFSEGGLLRFPRAPGYRASRMGPSGSPGQGQGGSSLPAAPPSSSEIAARIAWHMAKGSPGASPGMSPNRSPLRQSSLGPQRRDGGYAGSSPSSSHHSKHSQHSQAHSEWDPHPQAGTSANGSPSQVTSHRSIAGSAACHMSGSRNKHGASPSSSPGQRSPGQRSLGADQCLSAGSYHSDMDRGSRFKARYAHGEPSPGVNPQEEAPMNLGSSGSASPSRHGQREGDLRREALRCTEGSLGNPYVSHLSGGLQTQLSGSFGYSSDYGHSGGVGEGGGGTRGGALSSTSRLQKARAKTEPSEREAHPHQHQHQHQHQEPHFGVGSTCSTASAASREESGGTPGAAGKFPKSASESQARGVPAADPPRHTPLPCDSYNLTDLELADAEILAKGGRQSSLGESSAGESSLGSAASIGGAQDSLVEIFFFCEQPSAQEQAQAQAQNQNQSPGAAPIRISGGGHKEAGSKKKPALKSALKPAASAQHSAPFSGPASTKAGSKKPAHSMHGAYSAGFLSKWAQGKQPTQPPLSHAAAGSGGSAGGSSQWSSPALSPLLSPVSSSQLSSSSSGSMRSPQVTSPLRSPELRPSAGGGSQGGVGLGSGLAAERDLHGALRHTLSPNLLSNLLAPSASLSQSGAAASAYAALPRAGCAPTGAHHASCNPEAAPGTDSTAAGSDLASSGTPTGAFPALLASSSEERDQEQGQEQEQEQERITASGTCSKKGVRHGNGDSRRGSECARGGATKSADPRGDSTSSESEPGGPASTAPEVISHVSSPLATARPPPASGGPKRHTPSGTPWGSPTSSPMRRGRASGPKATSRRPIPGDTPGVPSSDPAVSSPLSRVSAAVAALPKSYRRLQEEPGPRSSRLHEEGQGEGALGARQQQTGQGLEQRQGQDETQGVGFSGAVGASGVVEGSLEEDLQRLLQKRVSQSCAHPGNANPGPHAHSHTPGHTSEHNPGHTSGQAPGHALGHPPGDSHSSGHGRVPGHGHSSDGSGPPPPTRRLLLGRTPSPIPARLLVSAQSGDASPFRKSSSLSGPDPANGEGGGSASPPFKAKSILISGQSRLHRVQSLGTGRRVTFCDNVQEL